ncbi:MAG: nicotinate-nucleotide--dimethylbenzimidazole phosphoribosyltransferase [Bacteroidales bacterium]|nr:nicotinate-nucleotide--dimethylbenzimidazole phosphoribosyltransferase [Bacteroidales bacterium]
MIKFNIEKPDISICVDLQKKIDNLTKPKGSLGMLEDIAMKIGTIQQTLEPMLSVPYNIVFASDHGIAGEGVSLSPQEVTYQMITNFLIGGAGINFLCRQHNFKIKVVDSGVNYDFPPTSGLIDLKIRKSTRNFLHEAAITIEERDLALQRGADVVTGCFNDGCNVISFGEMGVANTSASALWMSCLTKIPLKECVGAGCGLDDKGIFYKYKVLQEALNNYRGDFSTLDIISYFGGYEMVMAVGAMLRAAELKMIILIDGFIMTNCVLAASKLYQDVLDYSLFCHQGDESGHKLLLKYLNATPILNLNMRLGEGTGAVCAYPIVESAVRMINEMNSFDSIKVTKYFN